MSVTKTAADGERLVALLSEQRDLYKRLRELSERQRGLISNDRPEELLGILRERQTLVGALARLNDQLAPIRRNWDYLYRTLPAQARDQANNLLQEINALLRVILHTDQEDTALLSARKQTLGERIRDLSGGRSANAAYGRQAAGANTSGAADVTG